MSSRNDSAASNVHAIILLIAITIILAALILLTAIQWPRMLNDQEVPTIFAITTIQHTNQYGFLNFESYMVVRNIGGISYDNRKMYAKTYRNEELLPCTIPTINGHDFIPLHPHGIQTMGGFGTHDFSWYPDSTIYIDYSQGTFHPGDIVKFEVYDRETNQIISRDIWPHTTGNTKKWMDLLFNHLAS